MNSVHITQDTRLRGRRVLVVGLGLSGVSALRFLRRADAQVTVTDSRAAPAGIEALRAAFPDVSFQLGAFAAPEPLNQFDMAVVSPGVDLQEPFVQGLAAAGVPLIGDVELFARALAALPQPPKVIGITGSNGKSTVTTLVGAMARAAGWRVAVGGNLGTPALDLLAEDIELYVLELSSFQLETTRHLACDAAAYLNLSEDHLDRHGTMARYGAIKARIFEGAQVAVVNRDDAAVMAGQGTAALELIAAGDADDHGIEGFDSVVTTCAAGIAATGTVVLDHAEGRDAAALDDLERLVAQAVMAHIRIAREDALQPRHVLRRAAHPHLAHARIRR